MDFLADIATAVPVITVGMAFYRDAMLYFKPSNVDHHDQDRPGQKLLLDFIAGEEEIKSDTIKVTYKSKTAGPEISLATPHLDPIFASPNGALGFHAIYVILENMIRNSAKHGSKNGQDLEFVVCLNEESGYDDLIEVTICDNQNNAQRKVKILKDGKEIEVRLVEYLNHRIKENILDKKGALRPGAWGVLEMKIAAAYLRKIGAEDIDTPEDKLADLPPKGLKKPIILEACDKDGNLAYRFYLLKPKEILIIDPNERILKLVKEDDTKKKLRNRGIEIVCLEDIPNRLKTTLDHNFLVLLDKDNDVENQLMKNKKRFPIRVLESVHTRKVTDLVSDIQGGKVDSIDELLTYFWEEWYSKKLSPLKLAIHYEPMSEKPTNWEIEDLSWTIGNWTDEKHFPKYVINGNRFVVYDNHAESSNQEYFVSKGSSGRWTRKDCAEFYEPFNKPRPIFNILKNTSPNARTALKKRLVYELIEAGSTKVAIIDERIQSFLNRTERIGNITFVTSDILNLMNIKCPTKGEGDDIDLDNPKAGREKINNWVGQNVREENFLVVHLGILEKMFENDEKQIEQWIIDKENRGVIVVLTSGRGTPKLVKTLGTRFIHYSQVSRYVLEERSKFHLTKVLYSARSSP